MAKNEDGEFELILGNRQLLSVFFIVVILLGVFFTMGYIVGRNSSPAAPDVAATHKETAPPLVVDSPSRPPEPVIDTPAPSAPPKETAAKRPPATETPKPPGPAKETKLEPARSEAATAEKSAPSDEPGAGQTYLQLAATGKREADIMVDVLRQKKFKAMAAEIPERLGTFRVLVGPLTDGDVNKWRADLQGAGFPGNAAIKRTF